MSRRGDNPLWDEDGEEPVKMRPPPEPDFGLALGARESAELRGSVAALKADLARVEGLAASAFALLMTLVHELLGSGTMPRERVVVLVSAAIAALQRMYEVPNGDPFAGDKIDFEKLTAALDAAQHEKTAEDLLRRLLASLTREPPPGG